MVNKFSILLIFLCLGLEVKAQKSVIETDERLPVTSASASPFRYIGHMATLCTGFLVGPRHILTAAHCVIDSDSKTWKWSLYYSPIRQGEFFPQGTKNWRKVYVHRNYVDEENSAYDFALIELKEPVGRKLGSFNLADTTLVKDQKLPLLIAGYPGDKPSGSFWSASCDGERDQDFWSYTCDTFGGMSGSPVVTFVEGRPVVVGIHILGNTTINKATWLNSEKLKYIWSWMRDLTPNGSMTYSNPYEEMRDAFNKVAIENKCTKPITLSVYYKNMQKEWVLNKDQLIMPGQSFHFDTLTRSRYFFTAQTKGRVWQGGKYCKQLDELKDVCLTRVDLGDPNWKQYQLPLSCD